MCREPLESVRRKPIVHVFYDVEASQVRWQKEPFEGAFVDHKDKNAFNEETVQRWRNTLNKVVVLYGWEMKNYRYYQISWIS
ncbi:hypothetical protein AMTR_s00056p00089200 [Amborella trichopoda]|uniref:TIR domain-containing protein n=1 Tax=Amborella trichopoda TaxID=13333 RepID=U5D153_AMBTC|nr:hypothetical protein AMTR_s00056p00089200 [Amborella trichopoda]